MLDTEELGVSILHDKPQALLHAHETLHGVDDNIGRSKRILTAMSRRMDRNKWLCIYSKLDLLFVYVFV
ncbi:hypothetical protein QQ045_028909 [Rhodiola kirilowii]